MSKKEKIDVKVTIKMSDQGKKNLDEIVDRINETGIEVTASSLVRSFLNDVHEKQQKGLKIVFPIDVAAIAPENEDPGIKKESRKTGGKKKNSRRSERN